MGDPNNPNPKDLPIEGIKYVEWLKGSCAASKVEFTEGGIGQTFVTVKITSARGCGIYSTVSFHTDLFGFITKKLKIQRNLSDESEMTTIKWE